MDQCRNTREDLLPGITCGVEVMPTSLNLFKLFPLKSFTREVIIPQTKNMIDWDTVLTYG